MKNHSLEHDKCAMGLTNKVFRFGLLAKSLQLCMTVTDDDDDADT